MGKKTNTLEGMSLNTDYDLVASVFKIEKEGDASTKKPISVVFNIEETGKKFKAASWDYKILDDIKKAFEENKVCNITISGTEYREAISIRLRSFEITDKEKAVLLEEETVTENLDYKEAIDQAIDTVTNENYKKLLKMAFSEKFYRWPAAKLMHHAFPGGLAMHSYNVYVSAMNIGTTYQDNKGLNVNFDLLITGSLLHDIGKVEEYSENGNFSIVGKMLSHIVLGIERIDEMCADLCLDKNSLEMIKLKHIIASHHGKYEFGSPNLPVLIESQIISMADNLDSKIEAACESLEFTNDGEASDKIRSMDNISLLKI